MQNIGIDLRIKELKNRQLIRKQLYERRKNKAFHQRSIDTEMEKSKTLLNEEREVICVLFIYCFHF